MFVITALRVGIHMDGTSHRSDRGNGKDAIGDVRLVSVWHGPQTVGTLHFSLYNNGPHSLSEFTLCMTGTLWLTDQHKVRGGDIVSTVSNFLEVRPDKTTLDAGAVWTFSIAGLNTWPRHATDGPLSAYLSFDGDRFEPVAVQPLARSQHAEELEHVQSEHDEQADSVAAAMTISVIPFPNVASVAIGPLSDDAAALHASDDMPRDLVALCDAVDALASRVVPGDHRILAPKQTPGIRRLSLTRVEDDRLGPEGYKVLFDGAEIHVEANGDTGLFYGLVTLAQMVIGARTAPTQFGFPVRGTLTDIPRFSWRGVLVDVARTYYPPDELRAIADLLAWHKINILHLHLNDDEAWRIEVDGYPQVAEHCVRRGHGLSVPPLLGSSFEPYGAAYSGDDIAGLEEHAKALQMTVVPEIDVPGHAHALIQAMPELRDPGDTGGYHSIQGFFGNALNPCLPETYAFLDAAFESTMRRFSGPMVHIGGDEVGPTSWAQSPTAQATAQQQGLATTGELQGKIISHVESKVSGAGRTVVAWEDTLEHAALDPDNSVVVSWQHPDTSHRRAQLGYDVVLAPGNAYYLDMMPDEDWDTAGGHWAGFVPMHRTYDFEADLGWPKHLLPKLRGVHACIWGEYMNDRRNFDALVFPRIFAFAERAWIDRTAKDFAGFQVRAKANASRVNRTGKQA